jgi:hypothetical protein
MKTFEFNGEVFYWETISSFNFREATSIPIEMNSFAMPSLPREACFDLFFKNGTKRTFNGADASKIRRFFPKSLG